MIGEISNVELQAKYTSDSDKLHMAYSFDLLKYVFSPKHIRETVTKFFNETKDGWPTWSFSNHDVVRHLSRWNKSKKDRKKFANLTCALLMSLKGTPCIYQGEELGQTQTKIEFDEIKDPPGKKFWPMDFGRDGCRTPMIWDETKKFAGFSKIKPWLPIKKEQLINSAKKQLKNKNSTYHFYKKFISLRKKIPFFNEKIYFENNDEVLIFYRGNQKEICCIFNLSEKEISINNSFGEILSHFPSQNIKAEFNKLRLLPYGFGYMAKDDLDEFII
jgi:alpha-glucosidase